MIISEALRKQPKQTNVFRAHFRLRTFTKLPVDFRNGNSLSARQNK